MINYLINKPFAILVFSDVQDEEGRPLVKHLKIDESTDIEQLKADCEEMESTRFIQIYFPNENEGKLARTDVDILLENGFTQVGDTLQYDLPISVPQPILDAIVEAIKEEDEGKVEALKNFWGRLGKVPNNNSRESAYPYLKDYGFEVTPRGYLIAYRNVADNYGIYKGVTYEQMYSQLEGLRKKVTDWKKKPSNYNVAVDEHGTLSTTSKPIDNETVIGNLQEVMNNSEFHFTDNYSNTMDIMVGKPVSQARKECDDDVTVDCSNGLHVGNTGFVSKGSFGDIGLVVLVDPADIVAVPEYNVNKMRTCRYLPIDFIDYDGNRVIPYSNNHEMFGASEDVLLRDTSVAGVMDFTIEEIQEHNLVPTNVAISVFQTSSDKEYDKELISSRVIRL